MRKILTFFFLLIASTSFSLTWETYTNMTNSAGQGVSTMANAIISYNGYVYLLGTGNTMSASSDTIYKFPLDLSSPVSVLGTKLPLGGGKYQSAFMYGNSIYYFPDRSDYVSGSRSLQGVYRANIINNVIGSFSKIGDLPFYKDHPYTMRTVIQNPDDNSYYIIGGSVLGENSWNSWCGFVQQTNSYSFFYSYNPYTEYWSNSYDIAMRTHDNNDDEIEPCRVITGENIFSVADVVKVSDGYIIGGSLYDPIIGLTVGYKFLKIDFNGNTISRTSDVLTNGIYFMNITKDYNDNVYLCGYTGSSGYIIKADSNLNTKFVKSYNLADSYTQLNDIEAYGNTLYAVGYTVYTNPNWISHNILVKLDLNGNCITSFSDQNMTYSGSAYYGITVVADTIYAVGSGISDTNQKYPILGAYDLNLNRKWIVNISNPGSAYFGIYDNVNFSYPVIAIIWVYSNTVGIYRVRADTGSYIDSASYTMIYTPYFNHHSMFRNGKYYLGTNTQIIMIDSNLNTRTVSAIASGSEISPATSNITYVKVSGSTIVDSWTNTVPFLSYGGSGSVYNGYLHYYGGLSKSATDVTNIHYYAPIGVSGTLGMWGSEYWPGPPMAYGNAVNLNDKVYFSGNPYPYPYPFTMIGTYGIGGSMLTWTYDAKAPKSTWGERLLAALGKLFRIGGTTDPKTYYPINDVFIADNFTPTITPTITPTWTPNLTPVTFNDWVQVPTPSSGIPGRSDHALIDGSEIGSPGWMFIALGFNYDTSLRDIWKSPNGSDWTLTYSFNTLSYKYSFGYITFNNKLWMIGGVDGSGVTNSVYSSTGYNIKWESRLPLPLAAPGVVVFNNYIYVIGGGDAGIGAGQASVFRSSNGTAWETVTLNAEFGQNAYAPAACVYNNKIWLIGGNYAYGSGTQNVYYSSDGVSWTLATDSAAFGKRSNAKALVFQNKMWLIGGESSNTYYNDTWYSTDGVNWTQYITDHTYTGRSRFGVTIFDGRIWIQGGYAGVGSNSSLRDAWYLIPGTPTITPTITKTFTPRNTATDTITPTLTPTLFITATITPTVTVTLTPTPYDIWWRTTGTVYHGSILMDSSNGKKVVTLPPESAIYFPDGQWKAKLSRDRIQPNTYLLYTPGSMQFTIIIQNRDGTEHDCSSDTCTVYFSVFKEP